MPDIPFPQAPQPRASNPLDTASQMQGLALRGLEAQRAQQSMEIQAQENAAKQAFGQLMQQHIDPNTGELDHHGLIVEASKNPVASRIVPDIYKYLKDQNEIDERIFGMKADNEIKKLDVVSKIAVPYLDKIGRGENATDQDIAGMIGEMANAGIYKNRKDATQALATILGSNVGTRENRNQVVRSLALFTQNSRDALDNTLQSISKQRELVNVVGPEGQPGLQTREQVLQGLQGGQGLPEQDVAAGGVAPPAEGAARPQAQPSGPAAAPGFVATGMAPAKQKYQEQQVDSFIKAEDQINKNLTGAEAIQMRIDETTKALKDFKTGPGTPTIMKMAGMAKAFGMEDVADRMMGGGKGAFAAAQEFEKLMVPHSMELLRQTLGGQGRITNLEFEKFAAANPNLETDPKALEKIFNFSKKLNDLAKLEAYALEEYKNHHKEGTYSITQFDNEFMQHLVRSKRLSSGDYKVESPGRFAPGKKEQE
jgi:hypothetical protein